jgi:hypothetical protein
MADTTIQRPIDAITASPRPEAKAGFSVPQAPAQAAKKRRLSRKWLVRLIIAVVMIIPIIAIAVALLVVRNLHQPQPLHRTHITPVTPTSTTAKTN